MHAYVQAAVLWVVPCVSMQPGTAWAWVGMDVHGTVCVGHDVPLQTWLSLCPARPDKFGSMNSDDCHASFTIQATLTACLQPA